MHLKRPQEKIISFPRSRIVIFWTFLLFTLAYYFNFIFGPYALVRLHDTFDSHFLHYVLQGKLLLKYGFFGWYPNWAGGIPSFVSQSPPYYLLNLLSTFLPLWLIYSLLCVSFMTLAAYGMFRMLRLLFQLDQRIAVWGGILFALANVADINIVVNEVFNFLFPLFFVWSMELGQFRLSNFQKGLRILGLLFISLLSYPVITLPFFPIIHLALVLVYGQPREKLGRLVIQTVMIWTGYVLLFTPYFFALYDYIPLAQRTYHFAYPGAFQAFKDFAYLFAKKLLSQPAAPLFICGLPLLRSSRNFRLAALLVIMSTIIFAFFLSPFRSLLAHTFIIKMDLSHFFLVLNVLMTISAALFVSETLTIGRIRPSFLICILALAASFWQPETFVGNPLVKISALAMGLSLLGIIRISDSLEIPSHRDDRYIRFLYMAFVIALVIMGMAAKQTNIPFSQPYARLYHNYPELNLTAKEGFGAVFRVGTVDVFPGVVQSYGLDTVGDRGVLFNKYYKQFIKAIILPQLKDPADEKFFDNYWADLYLTTQSSRLHPPDQRPASSWNIPLLLMMNVRYLVTRQPIVGLEPFIDWHEKIVGSGLPFRFLKHTKVDNFFKNALYLYRLKGTFPRGYLATTPIILSDRQEVMQQLIKENTADLRTKVFFDAADLPRKLWSKSFPPATGVSDKNPQLVQFSPDRLVFKGNLSVPAFLVITNNYDPHWFAWVNGKPAPIYRANIAFQAVYLDRSGPFEVVVEYHFPIIWWLHLICLLGIALFIATAWLPPGKGTIYKIMPADGDESENPLENLGMPSQAPTNYRLLGWLAGIVATLLYAAYLIVVLLAPLREPHASSQAASLGRHLYQLAVVPAVGLLLSTWIVMVEKYWHLLSKSAGPGEVAAPHMPLGEETPSPMPPQ